MRKLLSVILLFICYPSLYGQVITADDLFTLTSLPDKKIHNYVSRKGFVQTFRNIEGGDIVQEYFYRNSGKQSSDSAVRYLSRFITKGSAGFAYQTSSDIEYTTILKELKEEGFSSGNERNDSSLFFQKNDITVKVSDELQDELRIYRFRIDRKEMPASVKYADDLLAFDSHENLAYVFGRENIKKDMYFFSDKEVNKCTVLFPNTNRQVIFMWEDQANYRKPSFILIGGSLRAESSTDFNEAISMSKWRCKSGLYPGMRLQELVDLNESDFNFFGSNSEFALMAVPEKKGDIDFKRTGILLGCFNCNNSSTVQTEKVSAENALNNNLQLYVLSVILVP